MQLYDFTLILSGVDFDDDATIDRFYEAGCDDAVLGVRAGWHFAAFDREANSYADALISAIANVVEAGATVHAVEPAHLVTQADIHKRANISRASVSLYLKGKRGQGFPPPTANISEGAALWDWVDVARFLVDQGAIDASALDIALINKAAAQHKDELAQMANDLAGAKTALSTWAGLELH